VNKGLAQKDPTVVFADNQWHVCMTVEQQGKSAHEILLILRLGQGERGAANFAADQRQQ